MPTPQTDHPWRETWASRKDRFGSRAKPKLTTAQRAELKNRRESGELVRELAVEYDVSVSYIYNL